jgi:hypothetical protein
MWKKEVKYFRKRGIVEEEASRVIVHFMPPPIYLFPKTSSIKNIITFKAIHNAVVPTVIYSVDKINDGIVHD